MGSDGQPNAGEIGRGPRECPVFRRRSKRIADRDGWNRARHSTGERHVSIARASRRAPASAMAGTCSASRRSRARRLARALPVPIGPRAPCSRRRENSTRALRSQSRCEARRRNRSAAPRATFACGTYRRATLARATTGRTAAADMVMADIFRESVRAKMGSLARIRPSSPAPDRSRSHTDSPNTCFGQLGISTRS